MLIIKPVYLRKRAMSSWLPGRFPYRKCKIGNVLLYEFPFINLTFFGTLCLFPILLFLADRKFRPDCIVSHLTPSHRWASQLARILGCLLVAGMHGTDVYSYKTHSFQVGRIADLLVFRSEPIRRAYYRLYGQRVGRREFVALSGIAGDLIRNDLPQLPGGEVTFVTSASLIPLKRIDDVLEALARLTDRRWRYWILGDGPERTRLEQLAEERGIRDRVTFFGKVPRQEVPRYLDQALVFIMVSAPETLGLAYLEAMARGCIVVGAKGWGVDGIVKDGINGYLCEAGDVPGIAETLSKLLSSNAEERIAWRKASLRTMGNFDESMMAQRYLEAIKCVVEKVDG